MPNKALIKSIIFLALILAASSVHAWVEPTTVPPGNNILAPLNSSAFGQSKIGGLILNLGGAAHGLIVKAGLVGIGTDNPEAKLDVRGETRTDSLTVRGNATVNGLVNSVGNVSTNGSLCIKGDCKSAWPVTSPPSTDTLQSVTARGNTSNGAVNINGNLTFNSVLSTPGRMHIDGQEDLYILNKGTTRVSKAWGGTGNLAVEGNLCLNGECLGEWCPSGYFRKWFYENQKANYICLDKNAEVGCNEICYSDGSCENTGTYPRLFFYAKYINGEKYTRAYLYVYNCNQTVVCDSGYIKGTHAECRVIVCGNGFRIYADWADSSSLGGIYGRTYTEYGGRLYYFGSCSKNF